jgi:hypothetical protein
LRDKIAEQNINRNDENKVRTFNEFIQERHENFEFKFVDVSELTYSEQQVLSKKNKILDIIGGIPSNVKSIVISETMQKDNYTFMQTLGLWDSLNQRIII